MKRIFYNPLYNPSGRLALVGCGHEKCSADFSDGPGVRKKYIIHYIVNGKGYYEVNGNKYHLKKGDAFAIYPDDLVTYYADKKEPWEFAWIMFDGEDAHKCYESIGISHGNLVIHHADSAFLESVTNCLDFVEKNSGICSQLKLVSFVFESLTHLEHFEPKNIINDSKTNKYVNSAITYIEHYYGQGISVSDIASQVGLERSYFYRIFLKEKGITPNKFLMEFRINKAKKLIKMGLELKHIAVAVGFKDVYYFSKTFKKISGLTPSEYKDKNKNLGLPHAL